MLPTAICPARILLATKAHAGPYDVVQFDHPWQPEFAMAGALMPLDTLLKANPAYGMSDVPQAIQAYQQYNGTTYGLDLSTEPFVLYYRTDLFKQAGITQPPTTWAQYLQDANKLTTKTVYGAGSNYKRAVLRHDLGRPRLRKRRPSPSTQH